MDSASKSVDTTTAQTFPMLLMRMLDDERSREIVAWAADGESFAILKKEEFCNTVLPAYLGSIKFESFMRRLNRHGFETRQVSTLGRKDTAIWHPNFRRSYPELCKLVVQGEGVVNKKRRVSRSAPEEAVSVHDEEPAAHAVDAERQNLGEAAESNPHLEPPAARKNEELIPRMNQEEQHLSEHHSAMTVERPHQGVQPPENEKHKDTVESLQENRNANRFCTPVTTLATNFVTDELLDIPFFQNGSQLLGRGRMRRGTKSIIFESDCRLGGMDRSVGSVPSRDEDRLNNSGKRKREEEVPIDSATDESSSLPEDSENGKLSHLLELRQRICAHLELALQKKAGDPRSWVQHRGPVAFV